MILEVPLSDFADVLARTLSGERGVYVAGSGAGSVVTASTPGAGVIVCARSDRSVQQVTEELHVAGLTVYAGQWAEADRAHRSERESAEIYVAGVAYRTEAGTPGLWLDAYPVLPTQVQVLRTMYEEMVQTGEVAEVSFEEFVRLSDANVVVASPSDLNSYLSGKESRESAS
jgi:hypothetical protein